MEAAREIDDARSTGDAHRAGARRVARAAAPAVMRRRFLNHRRPARANWCRCSELASSGQRRWKVWFDGALAATWRISTANGLACRGSHISAIDHAEPLVPPPWSAVGICVSELPVPSIYGPSADENLPLNRPPWRDSQTTGTSGGQLLNIARAPLQK
jgi:hypothetical protein